MNEKKCSRCDQISTKYSCYCKACNSKHQLAYAKRSGYKDLKQHGQKIRAMVIEAKNKPCADCRILYPYFVMDLDHVRGKKAYGLASAASRRRSLKSIAEEIEKCDAVCANCHRIRTFTRTDSLIV